MNANTQDLRREFGDQPNWPNDVNVHKYERIASAAAGIGLLAFGGLRRAIVGGVMTLIGAALIQRGATGHSSLYNALRLSTAHGRRGPLASVPHGQGVKVKHSVTVRQPPAYVYNFWRSLENLPIFMHHLESVTVLGEGRSHWRAIGPAGKRVDWEAQIINDVEGELIAWRSLPESQVQNAGSVRFEAANGGQSTLITVTLEYAPPAGLLGALAAKLLGADPKVQIEDDMRRLRRLLETSELPHLAAAERQAERELPDPREAHSELAHEIASERVNNAAE